MMSRVTYFFPINLIWDVLKSHFWWKSRKKVSKGDGDLMVAYVVDIASGKGCELFRLQNSCVTSGRAKILADELSSRWFAFMSK